MAQARWGVHVRRSLHLGGLLRKLSVLDDVLDGFFLLSSLFAIAPPHWSLVVASQSQMLACFARWLALLTFLSPQSAGKAT